MGRDFTAGTGPGHLPLMRIVPTVRSLHPLLAKRSISAGSRNRRHYSNYFEYSSMFPRVTVLRVLVSSTTAAVGYASYTVQDSIQRARDWLQEKLDDASSVLNAFKGVPVKKAPGTLPLSDHRAATTPSSAADDAAMANDGEYSGFLRRMNEIDSLLLKAIRASGSDSGPTAAIGAQLPKVVVIGSQSSGKSSVLEALVGHSFLPKGHNMVTRRPLLLRLVHEPSAATDYAVFPEQPAVQLTDFGQVAEVIRQRNLDLAAGEWVSEDPVEVRVHSRSLPDLTLVDLPGYIAVTSRQQPEELQDRIRTLCERYISADNVILAVCAADTDLANAEALQAARKVDPRGRRTIGVLTKLDLVEPSVGARLLSTTSGEYHLDLGYVGVVCKPMQHTLTSMLASDLVKRQSEVEERFFTDHRDQYVGTRHGMRTLQRLLVSTLEARLKGSLGTVLARVQEELAEARYELKVRFGDNRRPSSAEAYAQEVAAVVRMQLQGLLNSIFARPMVRAFLERELFDHHLLEFFLHPTDATKDTDSDEEAHNALTRAGWGRRSANIVARRIAREVQEQVLAEPPLLKHPKAASVLLEHLEQAIRSASMAAADQIESALKPYRLMGSLDFTPSDWRAARARLASLLSASIRDCRWQADRLKRELGGEARVRRLVQKLSASDDDDEKSERVRLIVDLFRREQKLAALEKTIMGNKGCSTTEAERLLRSRQWPYSVYSFLKSASGCGSDGSGHGQHSVNSDGSISIISDGCTSACPQVYAYLLSRRLLSVASGHVHAELVSDLQSLPDLLLDKHLVDPLTLLSENAAKLQHAALVERLLSLEEARERLVYIFNHHSGPQ